MELAPIHRPDSGATRSPASWSTLEAGCPASQMISMSGRARRSSRAIARSLLTCPRPIDPLTYRTLGPLMPSPAGASRSLRRLAVARTPHARRTRRRRPARLWLRMCSCSSPSPVRRAAHLRALHAEPSTPEGSCVQAFRNQCVSSRERSRRATTVETDAPEPAPMSLDRSRGADRRSGRWAALSQMSWIPTGDERPRELGVQPPAQAPPRCTSSDHPGSAQVDDVPADLLEHDAVDKVHVHRLLP